MDRDWYEYIYIFIAESFLQIFYIKIHGTDVCILSNKLLHGNKVI